MSDITGNEPMLSGAPLPARCVFCHQAIIGEVVALHWGSAHPECAYQYGVDLARLGGMSNLMGHTMVYECIVNHELRREEVDGRSVYRGTWMGEEHLLTWDEWASLLGQAS